MKLAEARKEMGYTQKEFAQLIDVTNCYLCSLEKGRKQLTPKVRRRASEVLGIDPRVLE